LGVASPHHVQERPYINRAQNVLYIEADKNMKLGLFVTTTGLTKLYISSPRDALEASDIRLRKPEVKLKNDPFWTIVEPLVVERLPPGEVESVLPQWYW